MVELWVFPRCEARDRPHRILVNNRSIGGSIVQGGAAGQVIMMLQESENKKKYKDANSSHFAR